MNTRPLQLLTAGLLLTGCSIGPDYVRPETANVPVNFDDLPAGWKPASPADHLDKGAWWKRFNDSELNRLMDELESSNPTAAAALARLEQARSFSRAARSALLPAINFGPRAQSSRTSVNTFFNSDAVNFQGIENDSFRLPLDLTWEIDLWGRVRRERDAFDADTAEAAAAYENVLLSARAELAQTWFSLRSTDSEIDVIRDTVKLRQDALDLLTRRAKEGQSSDLDVVRADAETATAEAELASLQRRREELVGSIAMLTGKLAPGYRVAHRPLTGEPPRVPMTLPSELLERRPDIAEAERALAGASERIGVAEAALFPKISIDGTLGLASRASTNLLESASKYWTYGATASVPLLRRDILRQNVKRSEARYDELLANYRQTVLNAFREVDTYLASLRWLKTQEAAVSRAAESSTKASELANNRYKEGITSLLEPIDAERTRLLARRTEIQVRNQRFLDTIQLIKALGGGFGMNP